MSRDSDATMNVAEAGRTCEQVIDTVSEAVITDRRFLETVLTGVQALGLALLEDVPGSGKTLTARSVARALGLSFTRIQFTPDLLPTDVTGTNVYNEQAETFEFNEGPIFANVVLADEINRAPPKTQAALLEAMGEGQVTADGETRDLPDPFFVIATQNPVEQEGTFPLPEAQVDRFIVKTSMGYPEREGELLLLDRRESRNTQAPSAQRLLDAGSVSAVQAAVEEVGVARKLRGYIVDVGRATRTDDRVDVGVSPRGIQRSYEAARAEALLNGREFVVPDDVKAVAAPALAHRLVLTADAKVRNVAKETVVEDVLERVPVPTTG
jgi:MoxR-like ATPase